MLIKAKLPLENNSPSLPYFMMDLAQKSLALIKPLYPLSSSKTKLFGLFFFIHLFIVSLLLLIPQALADTNPVFETILPQNQKVSSPNEASSNSNSPEFAQDDKYNSTHDSVQDKTIDENSEYQQTNKSLANKTQKQNNNTEKVLPKAKFYNDISNIASLPLEIQQVVYANQASKPVINKQEVRSYVPERDVILQQLKDVASNDSLSDNEKQKQREIFQRMLDNLELYNTLVQEDERIVAELEKAQHITHELEQALAEANRIYTQEPPEIKSNSSSKLTSIVSDLSVKLSDTQTKLNDANYTYNYLQTLPNRAQNTISANNNHIYENNKRLNDAAQDLLEGESEALSFENVVLQYQNELLQTEVKSLTIFQDIVNYKIHILSVHKEYLIKYLNKARAKQNALLSEDIIKNQDIALGNYQAIPELKHEVDVNKQMSAYVDQILSQNVKLSKDLQIVDAALSTTRQIEKNLQEQLSDLSGSVILSRLLNRQQGLIPDVSISVKLDEYIPNLNLWMYDLRNSREEIFDVQSYVLHLIQKKPSFAPYREPLIELMRQRRALYDQLYTALSDGLSIAINLRTQYDELQNSSKRVKTVINDHLFWLASNQGISADFFIQYVNNLSSQLESFIEQSFKEGNLQITIFNFLKVIAPVILVGLFFYFMNDKIRQQINKLAMRLDKPNDGYLVTPQALFSNFFLIIPQAALITIIGAIIIFIVLDNFDDQKKLTYFLTLHLVCFLYMRHIMAPNSLVQRHFSVNPYIIAQNRVIIDQIWFVSVPMLLIANMRELEPTKITGDIIGYTIMILGSLYLTLFAIITVKRRFTEYTPTMTLYTLSLIGILTPLTITVMLALGYYYTVIQLLNRVAATLYLGFLYLIISQTLRRELYVAEIKMMRNAKEKLLQIGENIHGFSLTTSNSNQSLSSPRNTFNSKHSRNSSLSNYHLLSKGKMGGMANTVQINGSNNINQGSTAKLNNKGNDIFHQELVNNKAFKLFNAFLLCIFLYFMYLQWSDLAGVLTYLDKIYLWRNFTLVNGQNILSNYLSLGDVLVAIIIIIVATVLNRNLPILIERLFMLRANVTGQSRSTSYTFKIITSYIITAFGFILAAGALGISWDNLQWLVAALSVGLGFGLQEIFANFVSGLIILFERQIRVGDIVTLSNVSGTVNKIRIRATTIISFDNKEVVIPNRQFITDALTNWSLSNTITKLEFAVGVGYDSDVVKAKEILQGIIQRSRHLNREHKPRIYVKSLDASAVTIMCEVYVNEIGKRKDTFDYLSIETLRLFKENGIEIPFDQLDVSIKNLDNGLSFTESQCNTIAQAIAGAVRNKKEQVCAVDDLPS